MNWVTVPRRANRNNPILNMAQGRTMESRIISTLGLGAAALAVLALGAASAHAEDETRVYRWKDANGNAYYGDYVPPEHSGAEHQVLNEYGVAVESVAGEKSAEQKAAAAEVARQQAIAAEAQRVAEVRDKVLLDTYLSVAEIEDLRDRRVELLGGQIRITQIYLDNLRGKLLKLEKEAQRYSPYSDNPNARPIDEKLARELSETLNSIHLYEQNLSKSQAELTQVEMKFADDIARLQELRGETRGLADSIPE